MSMRTSLTLVGIANGSVAFYDGSAGNPHHHNPAFDRRVALVHLLFPFT